MHAYGCMSHFKANSSNSHHWWKIVVITEKHSFQHNSKSHNLSQTKLNIHYNSSDRWYSCATCHTVGNDVSEWGPSNIPFGKYTLRQFHHLILASVPRVVRWDKSEESEEGKIKTWKEPSEAQMSSRIQSCSRTHTHTHTHTQTHSQLYTCLQYKQLTEQQHKFRCRVTCIFSYNTQIWILYVHIQSCICKHTHTHRACMHHLYWSVTIETSWLQSDSSCYGGWLCCGYTALFLFIFSLHINSVFFFSSLLFCKKQSCDPFFISMGRSCTPMHILPPPIWHCGRRVRGGKMFLQRWQDLSRIRGDGVSVKMWQLVWESMWRNEREGEKGGGDGAE